MYIYVCIYISRQHVARERVRISPADQPSRTVSSHAAVPGADSVAGRGGGGGGGDGGEGGGGDGCSQRGSTNVASSSKRQRRAVV